MPNEPPLAAGVATISRQTYDRFLDDDKAAKSTMLTFMDPNLEIIYDGQPTTKKSLLSDCDEETWWIDLASSRYVTKSRNYFAGIKELSSKPAIIKCIWEITPIVMS
ncbi:hypothetical protein IFM89_011338 [Coptis chinensis]|uniref:Uncharacterized protein n=1 Tax=Coptis chinensis TaxID=261450 RepID=A0A835M9C5_9MAGN|nr:hypothetical protein IFM89_011338 [Coptis chinensis]